MDDIQKLEQKQQQPLHVAPGRKSDVVAVAVANGTKKEKKRGFGFFRKVDASFPPINVGGGPGAMTVPVDLHRSTDRPELGSSGVDSREDTGAEEYESFAEDAVDERSARDDDAGQDSGEKSNDGDDDEDDEGKKEYRQVYNDRFQNFLGEVKMLRELNHPNICLLMGTCFVQQGKKNKLLLIYELMDEDLNSYINNTTKRKEIPSLFQRLKIASQIASGLSWVASKGIIHGDLVGVFFLFSFFSFSSAPHYISLPLPNSETYQYSAQRRNLQGD